MGFYSMVNCGIVELSVKVSLYVTTLLLGNTTLLLGNTCHKPSNHYGKKEKVGWVGQMKLDASLSTVWIC